MGNILSTLGRQRAEEFCAQLTQFHGAPKPDQWFSVDPARAQEAHALIQQDGQPFLNMITMLPKPNTKGDVIYVGADEMVAGRTDTTPDNSGNRKERQPQRTGDVGKNTYDMYKVDFDVAFDYETIDSWAMQQNFYDLWAAKVRQATGNSILRVGWHGVQYAPQTNRLTHPNGEDVAVGWLELIRTHVSNDAANGVHQPGPSQYLDGSGGLVVLGSGGADGFPNLDYLVSVAQTRLDIVYRYSPDLVALISPDLVAHEQNMMFFANGRKPEQKALLNSDGTLTHMYGGLPSYSPPFMPTGTVLVTALSNLHHYYQPSSMRRLVRDWAPLNEYQDFNSANRCYAIGDYRKCSLVEGITIAETQPLP